MMILIVKSLPCLVLLLLGLISFYPHTSCEAFIPNLPSKSSLLNTRLFSSSAPDDTAIQEAYARWRQKYSKGEFSPERYQNFKSNFLAVTARNNMERAKAKQTGAMAPTPIKLNQYGDCSAEEYARLMQTQSGPVNNGMSPPSSSSPYGRSSTMNNNVNNNSVMNGVRPSTPMSNMNNNMPGSSPLGSGRQRQQEMANNASSNLRAAMQQRSGLESDIGQLQATLAEKQRLLQEAINEEQFCSDRIALREEQKRILNERLRNGWDDER